MSCNIINNQPSHHSWIQQRSFFIIIDCPRFQKSQTLKMRHCPIFVPFQSSLRHISFASGGIVPVGFGGGCSGAMGAGREGQWISQWTLVAIQTRRAAKNQSVIPNTSSIISGHQLNNDLNKALVGTYLWKRKSWSGSHVVIWYSHYIDRH